MITAARALTGTEDIAPAFMHHIRGGFSKHIMRWRSKSELLNKVINVFADLLRLFLVDKVAAFHHNHFFQTRYIFLKPSVVYIFLVAHIGQVQITCDKLDWYCYSSPSPRCREFPVSASKGNKGEIIVLSYYRNGKYT